MRNLLAGALGAMMLSGCGAGIGGPSDHDALVASCVAEGEAESACTCIATAMQKNLSPELYKKTAGAVGRDKQNIVAYMDTLSLEESLEFAKVTSDMFACSLAESPAGQ